MNCQNQKFDRRFWVNLAKTTVASLAIATVISVGVAVIIHSDVTGFLLSCVVLTPLEYLMFFKQGYTWAQSLRAGANAFDHVRDMIRRFFDNNRPNGHLSGI